MRSAAARLKAANELLRLDSLTAAFAAVMCEQGGEMRATLVADLRRIMNAKEQPRK